MLKSLIIIFLFFYIKVKFILKELYIYIKKSDFLAVLKFLLVINIIIIIIMMNLKKKDKTRIFAVFYL